MSQAPWPGPVQPQRLVEVLHLATDLRAVVQDAAGARDDGLDARDVIPGIRFPEAALIPVKSPCFVGVIMYNPQSNPLVVISPANPFH